MIGTKKRTTFANEDFLDFSFNGKKASELGLIRVNTGKRQDEEILPSPKDTTIDIPGSDGVYYLNSKYQQREFTINFAYDGLYEDDIMQIRQWISIKKECQLIFSERPYKYYMAKPKGAPKLSYIAFDDDSGNRVYKGEGTVQFVCYYPWARSVTRFKPELFKIMNPKLKGSDSPEDNTETDLIQYKNIPTDQQLECSGLITEDEKLAYSIDKRREVPSSDGKIRNYITVWNRGQMDTPFKLLFKIGKKADGVSFVLYKGSTKIAQLTLNTNKPGWDTNKTYMLDMENHLIVSVVNIETNNGQITYDIEKDSKGKAIIMNGSILAGDFFNIPVATKEQERYIIVSRAEYYVLEEYPIYYDFLYY